MTHYVSVDNAAVEWWECTNCSMINSVEDGKQCSSIAVLYSVQSDDTCQYIWHATIGLSSWC